MIKSDTNHFFFYILQSTSSQEVKQIDCVSPQNTLDTLQPTYPGSPLTICPGELSTTCQNPPLDTQSSQTSQPSPGVQRSLVIEVPSPQGVKGNITLLRQVSIPLWLSIINISELKSLFLKINNNVHKEMFFG